jgi:hypothetical protein
MLRAFYLHNRKWRAIHDTGWRKISLGRGSGAGNSFRPLCPPSVIAHYARHAPRIYKCSYELQRTGCRTGDSSCEGPLVTERSLPSRHIAQSQTKAKGDPAAAERAVRQWQGKCAATSNLHHSCACWDRCKNRATRRKIGANAKEWAPRLIISARRPVPIRLLCHWFREPATVTACSHRSVRSSHQKR